MVVVIVVITRLFFGAKVEKSRSVLPRFAFSLRLKLAEPTK